MQDFGTGTIVRITTITDDRTALLQLTQVVALKRVLSLFETVRTLNVTEYYGGHKKYVNCVHIHIYIYIYV